MSYLPRINKIFSEVSLTPEEIRRYGRHLIMPEVNEEGQRKLKAARVLVIGAGGLGSPLLAYLSAAGVGVIGLVEFDVVDESNLQRQIIHKTKNVGKSKVASAAEAIAEINPLVKVDIHETKLHSGNAIGILKDYDVVVDGSDNFPTRYLVNDACVILDKPNVYGSIFRFEGRASVFWGSQGPCYRCLYPQPPPPGEVPSCAEAGVLGVLPGVIGSIQALETVKLIIGQGDPLLGRMLFFDALKMKFRELNLRNDPACPICGEHRTVTELIDYEQFCGLKESAGKSPAITEVSVSELKKIMESGTAFELIDVREPHEYKVAHIQGSKLIPLGEISRRTGELDSKMDILLHCKSGARSAQACQILRAAGFAKVKNVTGGIDAWSREVDSSVPLY